MDESSSLHERLAEHELALLRPEVRASARRLDALIADDFSEIAATGRTFGKEEVLARLPTESGVLFAVSDLQARLIAPDVALVTYRACRGAGDDVRYSLRSSLWRHNAVGWQMVFHQGTPLSADDIPPDQVFDFPTR